MDKLVARTFVLLLLLLTLSVAAADRPSPMSPAELGDAVKAVVELRGDRPLLLIGELHGSWVAPRIAAGVVERIAASGPVKLALEIPVQEQARVAAFTVSDGGSVALAELLAGGFWQRPREPSDGRRSEAIVELLQQMRRRRAAGSDIDVVLIDDEVFHRPGASRKDGMAAQLEQQVGSGAVPVVALIGNYHARRAAVTWSLLADGKPVDAPPLPTAIRVRGVDMVSVDIRGCAGAFWGCFDGDCGEQSLDGACPAGHVIRMQPLQAKADGYDLRVVLPRLTVAFPADPGVAGADELAP